MNSEYEDNWNPDSNRGDSILNKYVMNFTDKIIKKQQHIEEESESEYFASAHNRKEEDKDNESTKLSTTAEIDREENMMFDFNTGQREGIPMFEENFYDPLQDERNEDWVYSVLRKDKDSQPIVLSCPKCFSQVCFDCQMHESYENQFRAVFAHNCKINLTKTLKPQMSNGANKGNMIVEEEDIARIRQNFELYFSVECGVCETEIGVYAADSKIYHFFHVIPGLG